MTYIDKGLQFPDKLHAWAMNISHDYLTVYDANTLEIDATKAWKTTNLANPMETADDTGDWLPAMGRRRGRDKSPPKSNTPPSNISQLTPLTKSPPKKMHELPVKPGGNPQLAAIKDWNLYKRLVKPASKEPLMLTVREIDEDDPIEAANDTMEEITMTSNDDPIELDSTKAPKPPPFPTVSVNDGTHRLKFKWTVPEEFQHYATDTNKLNDAIKDLLADLFGDEDGMIYCWESEDLLRSAMLSTMTSTEI